MGLYKPVSHDSKAKQNIIGDLYFSDLYQLDLQILEHAVVLPE